MCNEQPHLTFIFQTDKNSFRNIRTELPKANLLPFSHIK
uniref:Uncharacterized protein n=1 Tax=Arundo donax TaxID=35708 RepID=A0A0A9C1M8_ARUDO